jgi:hypothetical protein
MISFINILVRENELFEVKRGSHNTSKTDFTKTLAYGKRDK